MATNTFSDIDFTLEIGQPTFVELITARRVTGVALQTICDSTSGETVCEEGPPPSILVRKLAFGRITTPTPPLQNQLSAVDAILPQTLAKYNVNGGSNIKAIKAQKIQNEFRQLLSNGPAALVEPLVVGEECAAGEEQVSYTDFTSNSGGWSGGSLGNGKITLTPTDNVLSQLFSGLYPNNDFRVAIAAASADDVTITLRLYDQSSNLISEQIFDNVSTATYEITGRIPIDGSVYATMLISGPANFTVEVDDILVCQTTAVKPCGTTNLTARLSWIGTPRQPVNIFQAFVVYNIRVGSNAHQITTILQHPTSTDHLSTEGCDFWKQEGDGGYVVPNVLNGYPPIIAQVAEGDIVAITDTNWTWSIPDAYSTQDQLIVRYPNPDEVVDGTTISGSSTCRTPDFNVCVVESIDLYFLMNRIDPITPISSPGDGCPPDPATGLLATIRYTNFENKVKEFSVVVNVADLYGQTDDIDDWDASKSIGDGIAGSEARWDKFRFVLDTPAGSGLDQCSPVLNYTTTGTGDIDINHLTVGGAGFARAPCVATVEVSNFAIGDVVNTIQTIVLPSPAPATQYVIGMDYNGVADTATVDWNATATQLRIKIGNLASIGGTRNVMVTGFGSISSPFVVEFIDQLSGIDMPLLTATIPDMGGGATITPQRDGIIEYARYDVAASFRPSNATSLAFSDTFTDVAGTDLTSHTSDSGHSWLTVWSNNGFLPQIITGNALENRDTFTLMRIDAVLPSDFVATLNVRLEDFGSQLGFVFRYVDNINFLSATIAHITGSGYLQLNIEAGGASTVLMQGTVPHNIGTTYSLTLTAVGNVLTLESSLEIITVLCNDYVAATSHGLEMHAVPGAIFPGDREGFFDSYIISGRSLLLEDYTAPVGVSRLDVNQWLSVNAGSLMVSPDGVHIDDFSDPFQVGYLKYGAVPDGEVQLSFKIYSTTWVDPIDVGIVLRMLDASNYYIVLISCPTPVGGTSSATLSIVQVQGGVRTTLTAASVSVQPNQFYQLNSSAGGDDPTAIIGQFGTTTITAVDTVFLQNDKFGFYLDHAAADTVRISDFLYTHSVALAGKDERQLLTVANSISSIDLTVNGGPEFYDFFDGDGVSLAAHSSSTGHTWTVKSGSFAISNNNLQINGGGAIALINDLNLTDCRIVARYDTKAYVVCGMILKYENDSNFVYVFTSKVARMTSATASDNIVVCGVAHRVNGVDTLMRVAMLSTLENQPQQFATQIVGNLIGTGNNRVFVNLDNRYWFTSIPMMLKFTSIATGAVPQGEYLSTYTISTARPWSESVATAICRFWLQLWYENDYITMVNEAPSASMIGRGIAYTTLTSADGTIEADLAVARGSIDRRDIGFSLQYADSQIKIGIAFRIQDNDNYLAAYVFSPLGNDNITQLRISSINAGVETVLTTQAVSGIDGTYYLVVTMNGNDISVQFRNIDFNITLSVTTALYNTAIKHGVYFHLIDNYSLPVGFVLPTKVRHNSYVKRLLFGVDATPPTATGQLGLYMWPKVNGLITLETLMVFDYEDSNQQTTVGPINTLIGQTAIETALQTIPWINGNVTVSALGIGEYAITFFQLLHQIGLPLMDAIVSGIITGDIEIAEIQTGSSTGVIQRIRIRAAGGSFRLKIPLPSGEVTAGPIPWDTDAARLESEIEAVPGIGPDDVSVMGASPSFEIIFAHTLGITTPVTALVGNLICDPFELSQVFGPPYDYELNVPAEEAIETPLVLEPLRDSANVYSRLQFERELFDPNLKIGTRKATLRDIALMRGVDIRQYTPYIRTCDNTRFEDASYSTELETQQSFVLIETAIDSKPERERILEHFRAHREVLPMRFTWDCWNP